MSRRLVQALLDQFKTVGGIARQRNPCALEKNLQVTKR